MSSANTQPVVILGATSDIAIAIAHEFARRGHPLHLTARDKSNLESSIPDFKTRYNIEAQTHNFDVLNIERHRAFFESLKPSPHIIVCAVGLLGDQSAQEKDVQQAQQVMLSNYVGPSLALEAAASFMAEGSTIIGISSVAGDRGRARNYYYGSAKAGFSEFLSGLRQKLNNRIHVITVKPGFVATRMTEGMDLPGPLVLQPKDLAKLVIKAYDRRAHIVYDWKWWMIMTIIRHIPERIFKTMKF